MSGKAARKLYRDRRDIELTEHDGGGDEQVTSGRAVFAGSRALCVFQHLDHLAAAVDERAARIRQQQLAAGAHHKLCPEMEFKVGDLPAHRRKRHPQISRRGRQAAAIDGRQQRSDSIEPVHRDLPRSETPTLQISGYCPKSEAPSSSGPGIPPAAKQEPNPCPRPSSSPAHRAALAATPPKPSPRRATVSSPRCAMRTAATARPPPAFAAKASMSSNST